MHTYVFLNPEELSNICLADGFSLILSIAQCSESRSLHTDWSKQRGLSISFGAETISDRSAFVFIKLDDQLASP